MRSSDETQCFGDILENIGRIERFVRGMSEEEFVQSEQTIFAVQYALLVVSEAAHRLGERAEAICPGAAWREARGMGNWLRHGYDQIDLGIVWVTIKDDLPPLKGAVLAALLRICEEA